MMEGMPDIPDFKGLATSGTDAGISLGGAALINTVLGNYWGIFNEYGVPILLADNVVSLNHSESFQICNAPVEKGGFVSYNKVKEPFKATVQLSKGSGGTLARGAFLAQIDMLANSTLKFNIVTPDYVYTNATIVRHSNARSAEDGAQLIKVNIDLEEVMEAKVDYSFEEVKKPDDAKTKDGGERQPQDASGNASILKKAADAVKGIFGN
ncbi:phage baseplate protein [Acinetobacter larvae]|uniref:Dit-like phage tail protein N-terminal domain-containing protein n=1 Tax=Acinetobacter larvae TaxID=1789224 RepID=A0A1B2LZG5_9GAMM|nr:hypothetical protein [Acinetobacter larvae]AOA58334.1 hypothetical protein BFG52_08185 [Acinetobacter larvae]